MPPAAAHTCSASAPSPAAWHPCSLSHSHTQRRWARSRPCSVPAQTPWPPLSRALSHPALGRLPCPCPHPRCGSGLRCMRPGLWPPLGQPRVSGRQGPAGASLVPPAQARLPEPRGVGCLPIRHLVTSREGPLPPTARRVGAGLTQRPEGSADTAPARPEGSPGQHGRKVRAPHGQGLGAGAARAFGSHLWLI